MKNFATSMTCPFAMSVATHGADLTGTWTAYGRTAKACSDVITVPLAAAVQGTGVSIAMRNRTAVTAKATALLPISDVVVFDGLAGIRSWSPPV